LDKQNNLDTLLLLQCILPKALPGGFYEKLASFCRETFSFSPEGTAQQSPGRSPGTAIENVISPVRAAQMFYPLDFCFALSGL
jgi:hypothetical protein